MKDTNQDLVEAAYECWPFIQMMYRRFEDKKPVILLDLQSGTIYAYPYRGYKKDLSERSQRMLEEQYKQAVREDKIVVFVRDNEQRRLASFSMERDREGFELRPAKIRRKRTARTKLTDGVKRSKTSARVIGKGR